MSVDPDEGWEARMAARAAARRRAEAEKFDEAVRLGWLTRKAEWAAWFQRRQTLGEAIETLATGGWACACSGDPCCIDAWANAEQLQRGAHIAARLFADLEANIERYGSAPK